MTERERNYAAGFEIEMTLLSATYPPYAGDDGLMRCGKCHTLKQERRKTAGGQEYVAAIDCLCRKQAKRALLLREMQDGIEDERAKKATFSGDDGADRESGAFLRRYVEKWDEMREKNIGLLLHGDVGGGKTFFAGCIANAIIEKAINEGNTHSAPVLMTTIPALRDEMQRDFGAKKAYVLRTIAETPLLILDDIGFEKTTPTAAELAFDIINQRYKANLPLIVTTNLTLADISNAQDMQQRRIFDRIVEMCVPVYVKADGRRRAVALDKSAAARALLGI